MAQRGKPLPVVLIKKIKEMRKEGKSIYAIAIALGLKWETVKKYAD